MEIMSKQLADQGSKQGEIQSSLDEQIDAQATELAKQVEAYKEQIVVKQNEEKEMVKVLKEYKSKY